MMDTFSPWSDDPRFPNYPGLAFAVAKVGNAIATEARRAGTVKQGPVHEGAGRQASPTPSQDQHKEAR